MVTTFPMNIDFLEEKLQYNCSAIDSVWNEMIDSINWILLIEFSFDSQWNKVTKTFKLALISLWIFYRGQMQL